MLTIIVFALVLVAAQVVAGLVIMRLCMTKRFVRKYYAKMMELSKEFIDEMEF